MASGGMMHSAVGKPSSNIMSVGKLPEEINEMKIRDDKAEKVGFSVLGENDYSLLVIYLLHLFVIIFSLSIGNRSDRGGRKWD